MAILSMHTDEPYVLEALRHGGGGLRAEGNGHHFAVGRGLLPDVD